MFLASSTVMPTQAHACTLAADSRTPTNAHAHERMHTRAEMGSTTQVTAPPELVNKMVAKGVRFAQTESISSEILPLLNPVLYAVTGIGLASACQSLLSESACVSVRIECAQARAKACSNHQEGNVESCLHARIGTCVATHAQRQKRARLMRESARHCVCVYVCLSVCLCLSVCVCVAYRLVAAKQT